MGTHGPPSSTAQTNPESRGTLHSERDWGEAPELYFWNLPKVRMERSGDYCYPSNMPRTSPVRGTGRNQIPRTAKGSWDNPRAVRIHADWKAWAATLFTAEIQG